MSEQKTSDSLDQSVDNGIDKAMAAKNMYDAANNIGGAAAEAGKAAAQSASAAGAGASAAAGTGAAAGSAAGPGGTVMGAIIGLAVSLFAKPIIKTLILVGIALVMIFSSLPSMFFENPVDVADNSGPIEVYAKFKEYAMEKYGEELDKRKKEIENYFQKRINNGEFKNYDHVEFTYSFNPPEDEFMAELMEASTLIIAMFEIQTDDWRKASFSQFKSAVNSVHFWNDTIAVEHAEEEHEVTYQLVYDADAKKYVEESTLHVHIIFDIFDMGVEAFRSKFGLADEREYIKSVEMAYNIKLFFGEADGLPMGGVTGGASGSYPGGGTHNAIRKALAELENPRDFFGGSVMMPLPSGTWSITSEFGPRNYAPDPLHTGIDFAAASGTQIYNVMDGVVLLRLTNMKTFGHHIVIYHGGGITTMYAHMSSFGPYHVGDDVKRGDVIGYVGRTGMGTGDHLHFEYQINGAAHNPRLLLPMS